MAAGGGTSAILSGLSGLSGTLEDMEPSVGRHVYLSDWLLSGVLAEGVSYL